MPATPVEPAKPAAEAKPESAKQYAKLQTTLGDLIVELDADSMPLSSANFARYVREGYYKGTIVHMVRKHKKHGQQIIMGTADTEMTKKDSGLHPPIECEWKPGMKNAKGTIGLVRAAMKRVSAQAEFFINVVDNPPGEDINPDGFGNAVFGRIVRGMDTVERIAAAKLIEHPKYKGWGPVTPEPFVVITDAKLIEAGDIDKEFRPYTPPAAAEKAAEPKKDAPAPAGH